MRTHTTIAFLAAIVAPVLATAGSATASDATPGYRPINQAERDGVGAVDLVMPDGTREGAQYAAHHFAAGIGDRPELYFIKVVRTERADQYVCRARWYRDAAAAEEHSAGRFTAKVWPALEMICPAPEPFPRSAVEEAEESLREAAQDIADAILDGRELQP